MEKNPITILVVEPDLITRKGIVSILNQVDDFKVVGEAVNAQEALNFLRSNPVDVVLTELWVKDEKKSLVASVGREFSGKTKVIVLTASQEAKHLFDAMRLGAQGYLLKALNPEIWVKLIRSVVKENEELSSQVACDILRQFAEQLSQESNEKLKVLSQREKEIMHLVALGKTNQEIAMELNISPNTVKNHIKRICDKIGVYNRTQLVTFAVRHGFTVKSHEP